MYIFFDKKNVYTENVGIQPYKVYAMTWFIRHLYLMFVADVRSDNLSQKSRVSDLIQVQVMSRDDGHVKPKSDLLKRWNIHINTM